MLETQKLILPNVLLHDMYFNYFKTFLDIHLESKNGIFLPCHMQIKNKWNISKTNIWDITRTNICIM